MWVWRVCNAEVCGTPGYLAPEIIECSMDAGHAGYGTAVDMWVCRDKRSRDAVQCRHFVSLIFLWFVQMEFRGDHVHAACRLSALLAQETDADAAHDPGRELRLLVSRMGGPLWHRQRFGRLFFTSHLVPLCDVRIRSCRKVWIKLCVWFPQISRMLVVDPKQRFTAADALNHSFFSQYVVDEVRQFSPYRRFKVRCFYVTKFRQILNYIHIHTAWRKCSDLFPTFQCWCWWLVQSCMFSLDISWYLIKFWPY